MRIIKKGKIKPVFLHGTCAACQCVVEVPPNECRYTANDGDPYVICPTAGCMVHIYLQAGKWKDILEKRNETEIANKYS